MLLDEKHAKLPQWWWLWDQVTRDRKFEGHRISVSHVFKEFSHIDKAWAFQCYCFRLIYHFRIKTIKKLNIKSPSLEEIFKAKLYLTSIIVFLIYNSNTFYFIQSIYSTSLILKYKVSKMQLLSRHDILSLREACSRR